MSYYGFLTFTLLHSITRYLKRAIAVRLQIEAIPRKVRRNPVALHILEPMSHPNLKQGFTYPKTSQTFYSYLADAQKSTGMPYTATIHSPKSRFIKSRLKSVRSLRYSIQNSQNSYILYCTAFTLQYKQNIEELKSREINPRMKRQVAQSPNT